MKPSIAATPAATAKATASGVRQGWRSPNVGTVSPTRAREEQSGQPQRRQGDRPQDRGVAGRESEGDIERGRRWR